MRKIYSDRDYFDEKFGEIDKQFTSLETKLDKMYSCVYGNGEEGLIDKVRLQAIHIFWMSWGLVALTAFVVINHLQSATDFIIELLKKRL